MSTRTQFAYFDIETRPTRDPDAIDRLIAAIEAPGNYKDPEKIAAYKAEKAESVVKKTALDPLHGSVCMIGAYVISGTACTHTIMLVDATGASEICVNGAPDERFAYLSTQHDEATLIRAFFAVWSELSMTDRVLVAYNGAKFDCTFLRKRALILGIRIPADWPVDDRGWANPKLHDPMLIWDARDYTSLDTLSRALGGPGKIDTAGVFAYEMLDSGNVQQAIEYLEGDLECLYHVHRVLKNLDATEHEDIDREIRTAGFSS